MTAKEIYRRILDTCREAGGMTRSEVAALTGLGRMTVSRAVERLLDIGALHETVAPHGAHKRPTGSLSLDPHGRFCVLDLSARDFSCFLFDGCGQIMQKTRYFYSDPFDFYDNLYAFENQILRKSCGTPMPETVMIPPERAPWIAGKLRPEYPDNTRIAAKVRDDLGLNEIVLLPIRDAVGTALREEKSAVNSPVFYLRVSDTLSAFAGTGGNVLPLQADRIPVRGTTVTLGECLTGTPVDNRAEAIVTVFRDAMAVCPELKIRLDTNDGSLADAVCDSLPEVAVRKDLPLYLRGAVCHMIGRRIEFFSEKASKPLAFPRDL